MFNINSLPDETLIPVKLVRMLIEEARQETSVTWLRLPEAAALLRMNQSTLRARCERWDASERPVVRVRKLGAGRMSHWLLAESDVLALSGPGRAHAYARVEEGPGPALAAAGPDVEAATIDYWCEVVTRNL